MALSAERLYAIKVRILSDVVAALREYKANGTPRANVLAMFDTEPVVRRDLHLRLGLVEGSVDSAEFADIVNAAHAQL